MLEIIVLILFIGLAVLGSLVWGLYRYRIDQRREKGMDERAAEWKGKTILDIIRELGDPFEVADGTSGRSMYIWKSPPSTALPQGSGLLTVMMTVDAGKVVDVEWRDHTL